MLRAALRTPCPKSWPTLRAVFDTFELNVSRLRPAVVRFWEKLPSRFSLTARAAVSASPINRPYRSTEGSVFLRPHQLCGDAHSRPEALLGGEIQRQVGLDPCQDAGASDVVPAVAVGEDRLEGLRGFGPVPFIGGVELSGGEGGEDFSAAVSKGRITAVL